MRTMEAKLKNVNAEFIRLSSVVGHRLFHPKGLIRDGEEFLFASREVRKAHTKGVPWETQEGISVEERTEASFMRIHHVVTFNINMSSPYLGPLVLTHSLALPLPSDHCIVHEFSRWIVWASWRGFFRWVAMAKKKTKIFWWFMAITNGSVWTHLRDIASQCPARGWGKYLNFISGENEPLRDVPGIIAVKGETAN